MNWRRAISELHHGLALYSVAIFQSKWEQPHNRSSLKYILYQFMNKIMLSEILWIAIPYNYWCIEWKNFTRTLLNCDLWMKDQTLAITKEINGALLQWGRSSNQLKCKTFWIQDCHWKIYSCQASPSDMVKIPYITAPLTWTNYCPH